MYVDKLDGRIEEDFYKRMRVQWRDEQERCERDIERHRGADDSYMDQGIQILSLGQNASRLFLAQPPKEKQSLLNFLLSNSTWAQGKLAVEFKEPFDLLMQTAGAASRAEAADGSESARNEVWLGRQDSQRQCERQPQGPENVCVSSFRKIILSHQNVTGKRLMATLSGRL